MMMTLTTPIEYAKLFLQSQGKDPGLWKDELKDEVHEQVLYIGLMAAVMWFGYMGKSYIFSYLGENVTLKIRQRIYESILEKNIGWFDFQENQSSVLTSVMA
jgi:ABC-type multidrug transport system fused ATPase/permease subunit